MNTRIYGALAALLLKNHFGLTLDDVGFAVPERIAADQARPFEEVNRLAEKYDLEQLPSKQRFAGNLTLQDEVDALAELHGITLLDEDAATCGHCGCRTDFEEGFHEERQHHRCLNTTGCGHEFVTEFEHA